MMLLPLHLLALLTALLPIPISHAQLTVPLTFTLSPPDDFALLPTVQDNFFGISVELSSVNTIFGNTTSQIPTPFLSYLTSIHTHQSFPLRIRIGGNSMDSSTYDPSQVSPMLIFTDPSADPSDVPVQFGPLLFNVMSALASLLPNSSTSNPSTSSIIYTFGLSLLTPSSPSTVLPIASAALTLLPPSSLSLFLLGNEPDLYYTHGDRPALSNYTSYDYMGDFSQLLGDLDGDASEGFKERGAIVGGPTICCDWDLATLLEEGYVSTFNASLGAITLQHYPQNNCFGSYQYPLSYYLAHANVVALAQWQSEGVAAARAAGKPVIMTEFNSASCGGINGISNTFGATLWTLDYALQLASAGFSAAHIHTREAGVTYNLFDPPPASDPQNTNWTTGAPYYALVVVADALSNGPMAVVDLGPINSQDDTTVQQAAYALYSTSGALPKLVLINSASSNASFTLPPNLISSNNQVLALSVKYLLSADTSTTNPYITWAGRGMSADGDGTFDGGEVPIGMACWGGGACAVEVPGPGAALVQMLVVNVSTTTTSASASGTSTAAEGSSTSSTYVAPPPTSDTGSGSTAAASTSAPPTSSTPSSDTASAPPTTLSIPPETTWTITSTPTSSSSTSSSRTASVISPTRTGQTAGASPNAFPGGATLVLGFLAVGGVILSLLSSL